MNILTHLILGASWSWRNHAAPTPTHACCWCCYLCVLILTFDTNHWHWAVNVHIAVRVVLFVPSTGMHHKKIVSLFSGRLFLGISFI